MSTLDFANGVQLKGFRIRLSSAAAPTTELELRNGQTFAIAGLLNNSMTSTMQKIPGIGDIPILGYLFRSKAAQKNRTELVVMITPQLLQEGSAGVTRDLPRLREPYARRCATTRRSRRRRRRSRAAPRPRPRVSPA